MSKPSFNEPNPTLVIQKPGEVNTEGETIKDTVLKCPKCNKELKNEAGLASHIKFKHKKEDLLGLEAVYSGDIIRLLLPNSTEKIYDDKLKIWASGYKYEIPEGFILYKIVSMDKVQQISDRVDKHQRISHMDVICIKKDKVLLDYE